MRRALGMVQGWIDDGVIPGASFIVSRGTEVVVEAHLGLADAREGRPVDPATLWGVASITKPVTAAAVMACVDDGLITLDAPVAALLRVHHLNDQVTLRHLLRHCSGLPGFSRDNLELRMRHAPIEDFIASFLREEQFFAAGQWHLYSSVGYGLLSEVVGKIRTPPAPPGSGLSAQRVFRASALEILKGLGVGEATFIPTADEQRRIAWVRGTGQENTDWEITNSSYYRSLGMPWGGLFATSNAILAFVQAFINSSAGGEGALSRTARSQMITDTWAIPEAPSTVATNQRDVTWDPSHGPKDAVRWGLGWELKGNQTHEYMGDYCHESAFGHFGASGTVAWADPTEKLAVVLLTNQAWMSGWATTDNRLARLANSIMASLA